MLRSVLLAASLLVGLSAGAGTASAHGGMQNSETKVVKPYRVTLVIGEAESMRMKGRKGSGEMMLGGKNASCTFKGAMPGMAIVDRAAACNHHVEVHVSNVRSGKVITNGRISIVMVNTTKHMTVNVPIAAMTGGGTKDMHYGNNVYLPGGWYTITVKVNSVRATFRMPVLTNF